MGSPWCGSSPVWALGRPFGRWAASISNDTGFPRNPFRDFTAPLRILAYLAICGYCGPLRLRRCSAENSFVRPLAAEKQNRASNRPLRAEQQRLSYRREKLPVRRTGARYARLRIIASTAELRRDT